MPNIFKHLSRSKAEPYQFPDASEILIEAAKKPVFEPEEFSDEPEENETVQEVSQPTPETPIDYAKLQAEMILEDARRQAADILDQARQEAARLAEDAAAAGREDGFQAGYADGLGRGAEESAKKLKEDAAAQAAEVQRFLEKAGAALDQQLDDNVGELRDLALAVAEKVVCISLKSSAEVVARMIQTAVDKRKRREWVHIYVAECDARRMTPIPASLSASLTALSDRVRIIPMASDESGTCIIEMPNEIIDASAATQLSNLRTLLSDTPSDGGGGKLF